MSSCKYAQKVANIHISVIIACTYVSDKYVSHKENG